jgi:hypothetical protein
MASIGVLLGWVPVRAVRKRRVEPARVGPGSLRGGTGHEPAGAVEPAHELEPLAGEGLAECRLVEDPGGEAAAFIAPLAMEIHGAADEATIAAIRSGLPSDVSVLIGADYLSGFVRLSR